MERESISFESKRVSSRFYLGFNIIFLGIKSEELWIGSAEMFFNLNLIQSHGSEICRAKKTMEVNGSPELVFEPMNDSDELTMVPESQIRPTCV